jgi:hypothetical protein
MSTIGCAVRIRTNLSYAVTRIIIAVVPATATIATNTTTSSSAAAAGRTSLKSLLAKRLLNGTAIVRLSVLPFLATYMPFCDNFIKCAIHCLTV